MDPMNILMEERTALRREIQCEKVKFPVVQNVCGTTPFGFKCIKDNDNNPIGKESISGAFEGKERPTNTRDSGESCKKGVREPVIYDELH